jgi:uncharacterized protein
MANRTLPQAREMRATLAQTARSAGLAARWACAAGLFLSAIAAPAAADYATGLNAFNRKDYPKAFAEWIDPAKGGEAAAQHGIGMLYEIGAGVPYADPKAAADWYQKAADQQYAPAINNLARLYADGRGVAADPAKAIELWSRAAAAGNNTARFNLGVQYANGAGVKKDEAKAAKYLEQAAEGGLAEAQFALAGFYRDGLGVAKDEAAARLWFQRAADAGLEQARQAITAMDQAAKEAAAPKPAEPAQPAAKTEAQTPPVNPAVPEQSAVDPTKPAQEAAAPQPEAAQKPAEPAAEAAIAPTAPKAEEQPAAEATQPPPPAPEPAEQAAAAPAETPAEEAPATEEPAAEIAEPAPAEEGTGAEGSAALNSHDPASELPLAESLSGDARIFRIWLYDSGQENDARSYWSKLTTQYPRLLKDLKLDLRRYFLGEAKGAIYRVFAGPFDSFSAAQGACNQIRERFGDQFCRPVIN